MDTDLQQAIISYGIIHPDFQRCGFGTVLLLSRLSALPEPLDCWIISLTTAGPSASFYQRFGFLRAGATQLRVGIKVDIYRTYLFHKGWRSCRKSLSDAGVTIQISGVTVPSINFLELAAQERE